MDVVLAYLAAHGGVAAGADLRALGVTDSQRSTLVRRGLLIRIRRDAFVLAEVWRAAPPWDRHALRARAVAAALCGPGRPHVLSHHSGLAVEDIGCFGVDNRVHLVRTDNQRGRSDDVVRVHPPVAAEWVLADSDPPVITPALAALQVAGAFGIVAGLVSADIVLREGRAGIEELRSAGAAGSFNHGLPAVRTVLELADGRSGSAGETRCRWEMVLAGMPTPELQAIICDERGELVGIVDFLFRGQMTVVEFDGALKYGTREDLVAEKHREDRLRALGYEVVRVTWEDLQHPERFIARIRAAFARATHRRDRAV